MKTPTRPAAREDAEVGTTASVTALLEDIAAGDHDAKQRLLEQVYHVLHSIADRRARHESPEADLTATVLVNEAYIRVFGAGPVSFENRRHLYAVFALAMREVLVDAARRRNSKKRNRKRVDLPLSSLSNPAPKEFSDPVPLDRALAQLERLDARAAEIVGLKCFVGLTDRQIVEITGLSERSIQREWSFARAFLRRVMSRHEQHDA